MGSAESQDPVANKKRKCAHAQDNVQLNAESHPTNSSKVAHERAIRVTNEAVDTMASVSMRQACREILHLRKRPLSNAEKVPYMMPQYAEADKLAVIAHIRQCKDHVQHLRSNTHLRTLVDRAEHELALEHYEECDRANGGHGRHVIIDGSFQVFFAEHWLPEWIETLPKTNPNLDDTMATKWRDKL